MTLISSVTSKDLHPIKFVLYWVTDGILLMSDGILLVTGRVLLVTDGALLVTKRTLYLTDGIVTDEYYW